MNIGEILDLVYDEDVGWRPSSGAIKPVHVANGLVRALQGQHFDTSNLNQFLVWVKYGKPQPERMFDAILAADAEGVFQAFRKSPDLFDRTRRYANGLLGADKALFPSAEHSSLSLTCGAMASRDNSDRGLGEFAALLIETSDRSKSLGGAVAECLDATTPRDPVTALVWPLLEVGGKEVKRAGRAGKALKQRHNRAIVSELSAAAEDLATHERSQGNRLRTLQRAVQFACIATHAHAQALAGGGDLDRRPPALLAMSGHRRSEIALRSERSVDMIYEKLEQWLAERLSVRIAADKPLTADESLERSASLDGRSVRSLFQRIRDATKKHEEPTRDLLDARMADFTTARRELGDDDPPRVLAHALVASYRREFESGGPRTFLQALGRKVGLLYPHFQGRAREKRVRPSVPILDMLVRACVPAGVTLPLEDFLERLWRRFGLIVGGRRNESWDDAELLAESSLIIDTDVLVKNTEEFVDELVTMGLARRYPDDVTFVGDTYGN